MLLIMVPSDLKMWPPSSVARIFLARLRSPPNVCLSPVLCLLLEALTLSTSMSIRLNTEDLWPVEDMHRCRPWGLTRKCDSLE